MRVCVSVYEGYKIQTVMPCQRQHYQILVAGVTTLFVCACVSKVSEEFGLVTSFGSLHRIIDDF